jgi:hypothetical protein
MVNAQYEKINLKIIPKQDDYFADVTNWGDGIGIKDTSVIELGEKEKNRIL